MVIIRPFLLSVALLLHSHISVAASQTDATADKYGMALKQGQDLWSQEQLEQLQKPLRSKLQTPSGKEIQSKKIEDESSQETVYKILVTDEMGERELRSLISELKHRKDVSFVIKGFLPTERTFGDISRRIWTLIKGLDEVPNIGLDPRPFREIGAMTAPVITAYRGETLIAYASGIANPNWLADQIEQGKAGNLGNYGSVYTITEIAPEEVAAERAKHLDYEKIKQQAQDNYFKNIVFYELPIATENLIRRFEPLVTVNEPILDADGKEIVSVGVTHNLLSELPMTQRIVVFDGTNKDQIEWVRSLPKSKRPTKYITTRFDNTKKAEGYRSMEQAVGKPVYLLTKDLVFSFQLQKTPSLVEADNQAKEFVISEFDVRGQSRE